MHVPCTRWARYRSLVPAAIALSAAVTVVYADGTEMLGDRVGLILEPGTDVLMAGIGLRDAQPGNVVIDVPAGAAVNQVILYWEGLDTSEFGQGPTDTITLNGSIDVTGDRIGGPTLFFANAWTSTYRADITALGLVGAGANAIAVSGLDFSFANCGAGAVVIIDDGSPLCAIGLKDGNDAAFINFNSPLDTTVPVTFNFTPSAQPRMASLGNFYGSVALEDPTGAIGRPSIVRVTTSDGVITDFLDELTNADGNEWDTFELTVPVAPGVNSLTIQTLSQDSGTGPFAGNLPASLVWMTSSLCLLDDEPPHPGWNWVDVGITLTKNQVAYWSALTGDPGPGGAAVSPFTILDPGPDPQSPGRPATDGTTDRVLRGFVYAWAVDNQNREISWNHLKGDVTIVNYRDHTAWEYNAWAFQDAQNLSAGTLLASPYGQLDLDGFEYAPGYAQLQLDFYASGAMAFSGGTGPFVGSIVHDTDLTLHPVQADFRQEGNGPITTKADFVIWNEDETQLNSLHRCISCWDQQLLSLYTVTINHFLIDYLQTDKGRARIDGVAGFNDCGPQAQAVSLLGVAAKQLTFAGGQVFDAAGMNLTGLGTEPRVAAIQFDLNGGLPPTLQDPGSSPDLQGSARMTNRAQPTAPPPLALGNGGQDRVSGTEKGSLLIFSKVEIRWDAAGNLIQDTFLDISNDWPEDVHVQMYFVNGDPPTQGAGGE